MGGEVEEVEVAVSLCWLKHWDDRYQKYYYDHIDGKKTSEQWRERGVGIENKR